MEGCQGNLLWLEGSQQNWIFRALHVEIGFAPLTPPIPTYLIMTCHYYITFKNAHSIASLFHTPFDLGSDNVTEVQTPCLISKEFSDLEIPH